VIVEDDYEARETLLDVLDNNEYVIKGFGTAEDGLEHIKNHPVDLVISDLVLPGKMNGIDLLAEVKNEYTGIEVIMVTGHATVDTAINAMKIGAFDYLTKPIDISKLRILVEKALNHRKSEIERNALIESVAHGVGFFGMYGVSKGYMSMIRRIKLVADTESTVLILGESGTGKELIADAIHNLSSRKDGPFIKVNLNAIPESLLESELFGHVKGAFTGAEKNRKGMFQQANNGTILLDEIGDMPYHLQAKLLRVIETKNVTPIGSESPTKLSIRIIASTNKNLEEMSAEGTFREDLFFRLSVFTINPVPLRERKEDIPILCRHFLKKLTKKLNKNIEGISPEVFNAFNRYSWPGNIRQLASIIEEMILITEGTVITEIPPIIKRSFGKNYEENNEVNHSQQVNPGYSLDDLEREAIINAMKETDGNKKKAAKILGIGLRTLYRKIEKYGL